MTEGHEGMSFCEGCPFARGITAVNFVQVNHEKSWGTMLVLNFCFAKTFNFTPENPCKDTTHDVTVNLVDTRWDEYVDIWMYPALQIQNDTEKCEGSSFAILEDGSMVETCGTFPGQRSDAPLIEFEAEDDEEQE